MRWQWSRFAALSASAGVLCLGIAASASAQVVRGRVLTPDSSAVAGAIVLLVDSTGATSARTLSDASGGFSLHPPADGSYRLRTLRIGYRPYTGEPFRVAGGGVVSVNAIVSAAAVTLSAIRVSGKNECRTDQTEGSAALALWTEARKGLLAAVLSRESRRLTVRIATYDRILDNNGRIESQKVRVESGPSNRPFTTLSATEFEKRGYAESDQTGGTLYRAPDAEVLLAEEFGIGHCLRVASSRDTALIGLGFAPVRDRDTLVDVAGTLWLDRHTAELRSLDFHYTNVRGAFANDEGGGRIEFLRLPGGAWIIPRWSLRLPLVTEVRTAAATLGAAPGGRTALESRGQRVERRVRGIQISGGALLNASEPGAPPWGARMASVAGVVTEGAERRPLPGAQVGLVGTNYRAITDSAGRFSLPEVMAGRYAVELRNPVLDSMGVAAERIPDVAVGDSGTVRLALSLPSPQEALARKCDVSGSTPNEPLILLRGLLLEGPGLRIAPDRDVLVSWAAGVTDHGDKAPGDLVVQYEHRQARTGRDGEFEMCRIPGGKRLLFQAERGDGVMVRVDSVAAPMLRPFMRRVLKVP